VPEGAAYAQDLMGYNPIMRFTMVLLACLVANGCTTVQNLKPGKKGTMSCSCGGTGCGLQALHGRRGRAVAARPRTLTRATGSATGND